MKELEQLENTIIVLETMVFGKGFSKTEIEALNYSIKSLKEIKDLYMLYKNEESVS